MTLRAIAGLVATAVILIGPSTHVVPVGTVDSLVDAMTPREKVGQLVMAPISGTSLSDADRDLLAETRLGGVILFSGNYRDRTRLARLAAQIQRTGRARSGHGIGMLVSADQEGGVVKRFPDLAPAYGAPTVSSTDMARSMGRATGLGLASVGVNYNLAPVADRDRGPTHMMASRSFGSAVRTITPRVAAYLDGLNGAGVAGSLKHYPGLGASSVNTDDAPATVRLSREEILADERPFQVARGRSLTTVMTSHAVYPALKPGKPASVSAVMYRLLHERLGQQVLVITDSLNAIAWAFDGRTPKACAAAIAAGADVALITGGASTTRWCVRQILAAVRDGRISKARLDEAVTRVLRLKQSLGLISG